MRFVVRIVCIVAGLLAPPAIGASAFGRSGAVVGAVLGVLGVLWLWLWLPRLAHAAFEAGSYVIAARRYRWLQYLAASSTRERAARLSRSGCFVATGELAAAERLLAAIDGATLAPGERAVWLNNRACVHLAANRDPETALVIADEAGALRPDVPAVQHTRAMALIEVGRIDDAISVLDNMRAAGELPPRLEADRCRELARAWAAKGETGYAEDYRLRADSYSR